MSRQCKGKVKTRSRSRRGSSKVKPKPSKAERQGQGKINVRLRQSNHNHNHNYNLMGFDTIEINLVFHYKLSSLSRFASLERRGENGSALKLIIIIM